MRLSTRTLALVAATLVGGCAGKLLVFDEKQAPVVGVPFRTAEVYVKTGLHKKHSKGGVCDPTPFVETASLPTGARYYVIAQTAQFAKTAFHIKFADNGAVAEIGLDSEPAAADTLKATNDLIKTLVPSLGAAAAAATAASAAAAPEFSTASTKPPACDAGEDEVKFIRLDQYLAGVR